MDIRIAFIAGLFLFFFTLPALSIQNHQSEESFFPENNIENFIVENLDLSTFRNSLGPKRETGKRFFSDLNMKPTKISDGLIEFEEEDWYYIIKIIERGDLNRDGLEDLIIQFIDDAKTGTYLTSEYYLVTRFSNIGNIIAIAYEPKIKIKTE